MRSGAKRSQIGTDLVSVAREFRPILGHFYVSESKDTHRVWLHVEHASVAWMSVFVKAMGGR